MPDAPVQDLTTPLTALNGIGSERGAALERLGLETVRDLLLHRPRRHEDRRGIQSIAALREGETCLATGTVTALGIKRFRRGTRSVFELVLEDGTGRLHCRWWNAPYMQDYFKQGDVLAVHGKVRSLRPRAIDHPETEIIGEDDDASIHLGRIVPVYPLTEGVSQRWLRSQIWRRLQEFGGLFQEPFPDGTPPDFPEIRQAVQQLHFPEEMDEARLARRRLALDEFTDLQLELLRRRQRLEANAKGLDCKGDNRLIKPFLAALPFKLTGEQSRVLRELRADMGGPFPMRRLLQGDVGSGKTVVAACCALMALESGYNVVLMAPTEILAEQHYRQFREWLDPLDVRVHLRTGSRKTTQQDDLQTPALPPDEQKIASLPDDRQPTLHIGTHALVQSGFAVDKLGLAIIDEQHKFGVEQREKLLRKGHYPHLLVMTATPIPRTLGLTLYGDLDISVIEKLPPGRGKMRTFVRTQEKLPKVWEFVKTQLDAGRQAYVVYPRVEDDDNRRLKAVTREFEQIAATMKPHRAGLLHGRLPAEERDRAMLAFRANSIQLLAATSVIEVGVDVPNATVMVVENADRFGLAQLHQLRGRIGRGAHESYCILIGEEKTDEARRRLRVMAGTNDGFKIAEADLELRGPGEFLGRDQSGLPPFRFGSLQKDAALIQAARRRARELFANHPELK